MNYVDLTYANNDIGIEGIVLPQEILLSLEIRGKRNENHRFETESQEIQIRCSHCNSWIGVFKLDNGIWVDISHEKYWLSKKEHSQMNYFSNKCYTCYQSGKRNNIKEQDLEELDMGEVNADELKEFNLKYCAWSSKNKGIQQTIALTKENDRFVKLYTAFYDIKKNAFINLLIDKYRAKNKNPFDDK